MSKATRAMRSFSPWPENQERLEYAQKLGLEVSQIVNEILSEHLRHYLTKIKQTKGKELRAALDAPVP